MDKEQLYIFLDIDGVLCTTSWCSFVYKHECKPRSRELDPRALGLFNHICNELNAKVIISSCWRGGTSTLKELKNKFKPYGCSFNIVGRTGEHVEIDEGGRGIEISNFLKEHTKIKNYIIIDDEHDAGIGHDWKFIQTISHEGFTIFDYKTVFERIGWYKNSISEFKKKRRKEKLDEHGD